MVTNNTNVVSSGEGTYVSVEQLSSLLSESGFIFLGHGTGRSGNGDQVVDSIFSKGLRTKDNSLYYTTVGLSAPTPELKDQFKEFDLPEPTIGGLKEQLNNWPHLNSKKVIIVRLPLEYVNSMGDISDLDGERYGAFFREELQENGRKTYYLDPKFIVGCFDVDKQMVRLNEGFEQTLTPETISILREGYKMALEKTKTRLTRLESNLFGTGEQSDLSTPQDGVLSGTIDFDANFGEFEDIKWDDSPSSGKSK